MRHSYTQAANVKPLDEANFRKTCSALASGQTTRQGALCPVAEQTRVNFERCRVYCDEVATRFPQFKQRCDKLKEMIDLCEQLIKRTVMQRVKGAAARGAGRSPLATGCSSRPAAGREGARRSSPPPRPTRRRLPISTRRCTR